MPTMQYQLFSSKRTVVFLCVLFGITIVFLFTALNPQLANSNFVYSTSIPTPIIQTSLYFDPSQDVISTRSAELQKNAIMIDTGGNSVQLVQIELSFDPNIVNNIDIIPGKFFPAASIVLKNIDYDNGRISFALKSPPTRGKGVLAILSYGIVNPHSVQTMISFLPKTSASDPSFNRSVLLKTTGLLISFQ